MANKDAPFGFKTWGPVLDTMMCACPTAPTINISPGDVVINDNTFISSGKFGAIPSVFDTDVTEIQTSLGDAYLVLGVVLACFDEKMDPVQYIAAAEAGDGTVGGYFLVACSPLQKFVAQGDATFTAADLNLNYFITAGTLAAPDTRTGMSTMEIKIAGAAVTSTIPLRILGMAYPLEDSLTGAGCRMVVQFNPLCHYRGAGTMI